MLFRDFQDVLTCFRVVLFPVLKVVPYVVPSFMLLFFKGLVGPVLGSSGVCFWMFALPVS